MDVADFMLGITLLSRIPHDSKIKRKHSKNFLLVIVMFEVCDNDDDGCMNPV